MAGQLRVAVIGSETRYSDKPPLTYTVYRTSVNFQGFCYHRLIRFRQFRSFAKHLKLSPDAARLSVKFPSKIWWSRKASLEPETVEARQVLLNEFMQQVVARPLLPRSEEHLLKLLQVGPFAPQEEEDRVINSRLSCKHQSVTLTELTSEILDMNPSLQSEPSHQLPVNNKKQPQDSLTDEEEESGNVPNSLDSQGCSDLETRAVRSMSAPSSPVLQVQARPTSMSLTSQNMKRIIFGSNTEGDLLSFKEEGKDSVDDSSFDWASTHECHYSDQIKQAIARIENIVDSSRKLEVHIREKLTANRPMGARPS